MEFVDLSHVIDNDIKVNPLDPSAVLLHNKFLEKDGYNHFWLEIGLHTGTHIDSPMHMIHSEKYINNYDPGRFCGRAVLIDVREQDVIMYDEKYDQLIQKDDIVLFYSGHDARYRKKDYFSTHPVLDMEFAEFLGKKRISIVGLDFPSPDFTPYDVHKKLYEHDIIIMENLRNLGKLIGKSIRIYAFPLNIKADSSPVRVIAEISRNE